MIRFPFSRLSSLMATFVLGLLMSGTIVLLLASPKHTAAAQTAAFSLSGPQLITWTTYLPYVQTPVQTCYYVETNDAVVVEIESAPAVEQWQLESSFPGYTGTGYLVWGGPNLFATTGIAVLSYPVSLTHQGTYRFNIHNWHPTFPSDMNDVWVRLDDGDWIKGFSNVIDEWTWDFSFQTTSLGPPHFDDVQPGLHTISLSARSHGFAMDRFALSATGDGRDINWPVSPCVVP